MAHFFTLKLIILYVYIAAVAYTQFRGKVRLKFLRQVVNHSTFIAPVNALMYLFSGVPNKPYQSLDAFPELKKLTDNWQVIRAEAEQLVSMGLIKAADTHNDVGFNSFFKRGWKRFYLKWYDNCLPSALSLCPNTAALLKSVPNVHAAMFTLLPKDGQLKPHRDPYAGSLRYHLGLITPNSEKCRIYVDGIPYAWRDGEAVLFDETYIHSAKNETAMDRIILFCDVERPLTNKFATALNRIFCRYVMPEAATQNLETDPVGSLNKIYKYYRHLAEQLNRLKKTNKFLFQCLQYGGIAGFVYLVFFRF